MWVSHSEDGICSGGGKLKCFNPIYPETICKAPAVKVTYVGIVSIYAWPRTDPPVYVRNEREEELEQGRKEQFCDGKQRALSEGKENPVSPAISIH